MPDSLISVVIPCYNAERWIAQTLESIINQTHPADEVIVVDDGSTDSSASIVQSSFPTVHLLKVANGGPSRARNIGVKAAKGDWIQFLDADDLLHPQKLEWQVSYLEKMAPEVAFVFSPWQWLEQQGRIWQPINPPLSTSLDTDLYIQILDNFTPFGCGLIRKAWFERVSGFDESRWMIEDIQLQLRLIHAGAQMQIVPTPEPVFFYRRINTSLSSSSLDRFIAGCYSNAQLAEQFLQETQQLTEARKQLLSRAYIMVARYYAEHDAIRFAEVATRLEELMPSFRPKSPRSLAWLSKIIGYRRAEAVSVRYRQCKRKSGLV